VVKAIEQTRDGMVVGHARLGWFGQKRGSVAQQVYDGDTVTVEAEGNLGVRFLGIDAPEVAIPLPGTDLPFVKLSDPRWDAALADPFSGFDPPLDPDLRAHLQHRVGPGAACNHAAVAGAATRALEELVEADRTTAGKTVEELAFFLAFAGEVMDRYGRLLAYLHPDQAEVPREQRLDSYNERLLATGWVSPYFIWPNVNPFRRAGSVSAAVPVPGTARQVVEAESSLRDAREAVAATREQRIGLYQAGSPLRLLAFEVRCLRPPSAPGPVADRPVQRLRPAPRSAGLPRSGQPGGPVVHPRRVRPAVARTGLAVAGVPRALADTGRSAAATTSSTSLRPQALATGPRAG
jgi:endonuclease YncB( thermonuclease family)